MSDVVFIHISSTTALVNETPADELVLSEDVESSPLVNQTHGNRPGIDLGGVIGRADGLLALRGRRTRRARHGRIPGTCKGLHTVRYGRAIQYGVGTHHWYSVLGPGAWD